jgi:hypothetical protein
MVRALLKARKDVTFLELDSPFGHDAFLIDSELPKLAAVVRPFLDRSLDAARRRTEPRPSGSASSAAPTSSPPLPVGRGSEGDSTRVAEVER